MNLNPLDPDARSSRHAHPAFWTVLVAAGILLGCSTQSRQKWLTTFFDGVPGSRSTTNILRTPLDEDGRPLTLPSPPSTAALATAVTHPFVPHPPYENKQCGECHLSRFSVRMKGSERDVCFACHEDFLTHANSKHAPAENSECSSCHDPHGSSEKAMLLHPPATLCAECHEGPPADAKSRHKPVVDGQCSTCHNPHASTFPALLVQSEDKLCTSCHEETNQRLRSAKVRHQPVENGECSS